MDMMDAAADGDPHLSKSTLIQSQESKLGVQARESHLSLVGLKEKVVEAPPKMIYSIFIHYIYCSCASNFHDLSPSFVWFHGTLHRSMSWKRVRSLAKWPCCPMLRGAPASNAWKTASWWSSRPAPSGRSWPSSPMWHAPVASCNPWLGFKRKMVEPICCFGRAFWESLLVLF